MSALQEPRPPTNVKVTAGDSQVFLKWNAPTSGTSVERYAVSWSDDNFETGFGVAFEETEGTVSGLVNGKTYQFHVRSDNDTLGLYSEVSEIVAATPSAGLGVSVQDVVVVEETLEEHHDAPFAADASVSDLLGDELVKPDGSIVLRESLNGKYLALYFSAHWCPPCRQFTPVLASTYRAMKDAGRDDFEFIFISSDNDEENFKEYHGEMPWLALPYARRDTAAALSSKFGVGGIPTLVTLDPSLEIVSRGARGAAAADPMGLNFPWPALPYAELSATGECNGSSIDQSPALVVLCFMVQDSDREECIESLREISQSPAGKASELLFFTACANQGVAAHVLRDCTSSGLVLGTDPVLLLLDVPNGAFYFKACSFVTRAAIGEFIDAHQAQALTRFSLQ